MLDWLAFFSAFGFSCMLFLWPLMVQYVRYENSVFPMLFGLEVLFSSLGSSGWEKE